MTPVPGRHCCGSGSYILCVVVAHTHRWHPPNFWPNPKHYNGAVISPQLVCACFLACLPLACLLDSKEGYRTMISSTSSVTITSIEYWE